MGAGEREIVKGYEDMLGVMKIPVMLIVGMVCGCTHVPKLISLCALSLSSLFVSQQPVLEKKHRVKNY